MTEVGRAAPSAREGAEHDRCHQVDGDGGAFQRRRNRHHHHPLHVGLKHPPNRFDVGFRPHGRDVTTRTEFCGMLPAGTTGHRHRARGERHVLATGTVARRKG